MLKNYFDTPIVHIFCLYDKLTNGWLYYKRWYVSKFTNKIVGKHFQFLGGFIDFDDQRKSKLRIGQ